jgi:hypothetical protein
MHRRLVDDDHDLISKPSHPRILPAILGFNNQLPPCCVFAKPAPPGRCSPIWRAVIGDDKERPPAATRLIRRLLNRKTSSRLVKKYSRAAGIDPDRLGGIGTGMPWLRKTAINDTICNSASVHELGEFAAHADIMTTEVYFVRSEEDPEAGRAASRSGRGVPGSIEPRRRSSGDPLGPERYTLGFKPGKAPIAYGIGTDFAELTGVDSVRLEERCFGRADFLFI